MNGSDALRDSDEVLQINDLIYTAGKEVEHICKALTIPECDEKKYAKVIEKFGAHFVPRRNVIHERACFCQSVQKEGEIVEALIQNLNELPEHCEFGTQRDEQIRDGIAISIS